MSCVGSVRDPNISRASMPMVSTQRYALIALIHSIINSVYAQCLCLSSRTDVSAFYRAAFVGCVCCVVECGATQATDIVLEAEGLPDRDVVEGRRTFYDTMRTMRVTAHL